jgi:hypothetical protein
MPRPTPLIKSVGSASSTRGGKRHYVLGGRIQKGKSPTEGVPRGFRWVQWPGPLRRVGEYSRNLLCAHRKHASAQGSCFRPEEEHGYQNSCFMFASIGSPSQHGRVFVTARTVRAGWAVYRGHAFSNVHHKYSRQPIDRGEPVRSGASSVARSEGAVCHFHTLQRAA